MQCIATEGRKYGLILNNAKLEMMQINSDTVLHDMEGKVIKDKELLKYLGAVLHKTGRIDAEITAKIGVAKSDFRALGQIWKHANIKRKRNIELYKSLILSRFLYGLQTVWPTKTLLKRLNAFHCGCLRQILGIAHSYISRVTNADVLTQASESLLSNRILQQQLMFYGRLQRNTNHPARYLLHAQADKRRRGRPRLNWMSEVLKHVERMEIDNAVICNPVDWRKAVKNYCFKEGVV